MKRVLGFLLAGGVVVTVAGCGGDNTTTFVLPSGSAGASASPSGSVAASGNASPAGSSLPSTAPTPIPDGFKVIIDSPDASSSISSPVEVSGTASVANGALVAVVKDAAGNELGRATTTASAASPEYGHYDVNVTFSGATPGTKGQIQVFAASNQKTNYYISIRFS